MKISVVMTTYNGAKYLEEQLNSILSQTLLPEEIIICDDCSTDGTIAILEKYQQEKLLTYVRNEHRLGLIGNFKKAVSMAAQDNMVALSDQDDQWLPDKLEKSVSLMKTMNQAVPCLVHTDLILVDEQGKILNSSFRNELGQNNFQHNLQTLLFGNFVTGCTILMNPKLKRFFGEIPSSVQFHDGWIALAAFAFGEVNEVAEGMVRYRKHGSNLSIAQGTKPRNRYRSAFQQLMKFLTDRDDFLFSQFALVQQFYMQYKIEMDASKVLCFENFLQLKEKPYLVKKVAFRRIVQQFGIHN